MMTSKSVVALRHVHFEDLGHFAPILERHGYGLTYSDVGNDSLMSLDPLAAGLLIVLGGPIGAYEEEQYPFLHDELALLTSALSVYPRAAATPAAFTASPESDYNLFAKAKALRCPLLIFRGGMSKRFPPGAEQPFLRSHQNPSGS